MMKAKRNTNKEKKAKKKNKITEAIKSVISKPVNLISYCKIANETATQEIYVDGDYVNLMKDADFCDKEQVQELARDLMLEMDLNRAALKEMKNFKRDYSRNKDVNKRIGDFDLNYITRKLFSKSKRTQFEEAARAVFVLRKIKACKKSNLFSQDGYIDRAYDILTNAFPETCKYIDKIEEKFENLEITRDEYIRRRTSDLNVMKKDQYIKVLDSLEGLHLVYIKLEDTPTIILSNSVKKKAE